MGLTNFTKEFTSFFISVSFYAGQLPIISFLWLLNFLHLNINVLLLHTGTLDYLLVQICVSMNLFSHVLLVLLLTLGILEFFVVAC